MTRKHLDLGCGLKLRNPYAAELTFGCDIRDIDAGVKGIGFDYKKVNLVMEPIPYPDNYFDSVSAYDFFEHVPRQVVLPNSEAVNPFINLMNEIHRVLVPGGRFFGSNARQLHHGRYPRVFHGETACRCNVRVQRCF